LHWHVWLERIQLSILTRNRSTTLIFQNIAAVICNDRTSWIWTSRSYILLATFKK